MTISTARDLLSAIRSCTGGETIETSGDITGFSLLAGQMPALSSPVTVRGDARFTAAVLRDAADLIFEDVTFTVAAGQPNYAQALRLYGGRNIRLSGTRHVGQINADGSRSGYGIMAAQTQGLHVEQADMRDLFVGASLDRVDGFAIAGADMLGLGGDGIFLAGAKRGTISAVRIDDFWQPADYDSATMHHPDGIQFASHAGSEPCEEIDIEDCLIRSRPGARIQGIFGWRSTGRHRALHIRRNLMIGTMWHGISVADTDDLLIEDNRVLHVAGDDDIRQSWISAKGSVGVVHGNLASQFLEMGRVRASHNGRIPPATREQVDREIEQWIAAHRQ